jgi:AcrR family transcriptional regulator
MRYPSNHKAATRQRIIDEASQRLRKDGIESTGLVPLMKALGLTHGGFYAHFDSKQALVHAALEAAAGEMLDEWQAPRDAAQLRTLIDAYLSAQHRDRPEQGCPLPTLSAELGLRGTPSPVSDALAADIAAALAPVELACGGKDAGLVALATMVGAISLARAMADPGTSERILAAARAAIRLPEQVTTQG